MSLTAPTLYRKLVMMFVCGAVVLAAEPVWAHHSFAMFDQHHPTQVTGWVKSWEFTNPHSWLDIVIMKQGQYVLYSVECGPPVLLVRKGWSKDSFKPGEKVTVTVAPLKDGGNGGSMIRAVAAGGATLSAG